MEQEKHTDSLGVPGSEQPAGLSASTLRSGPDDGTSAPIPNAPAHSPGPWFIGTPNWLPMNHDDKHIGIENEDWNICDVDGTIEEGEANARLIAAAPDMLDVLNEIEGEPMVRLPQDLWVKLRAAIRKATQP